MNTNEYHSLNFDTAEIPTISRLQSELAEQMHGYARRNGYGPGDSEKYDDWDDDEDDSDEFGDYEDWSSEEEDYYKHNFRHDYNR